MCTVGFRIAPVWIKNNVILEIAFEKKTAIHMYKVTAIGINSGQLCIKIYFMVKLTAKGAFSMKKKHKKTRFLLIKN